MVAFQIYLEHSLDTAVNVKDYGKVAHLNDYCLECLNSNDGVLFANRMSNYLFMYYDKVMTVKDILSLARKYLDNKDSRIFLDLL